MKKMIIYVLMGALLLSGAMSEIMITEIMYNPEGTDTDREWIELYNDGSQPVNLSGWTLREDNSNRVLSIYGGDFAVMPYSFAVIAKNGLNFTNEHPAYSGVIVESAISLTNSAGRNLTLFDNNNIVHDNVIYSNKAAEGYSIELNSSGLDNSYMDNWRQGAPGGDPGHLIVQGQNSVPEYDAAGAAIGLSLVAILFFCMRK